MKGIFIIDDVEFEWWFDYQNYPIRIFVRRSKTSGNVEGWGMWDVFNNKDYSGKYFNFWYSRELNYKDKYDKIFEMLNKYRMLL